MKKISLALFIIFSLFTFSACSLFSKDGASETLSGVLSEQAYGDDYSGTHLLTDDTGKVFAINSTVLNLSSSEYVGNKIQVQAEYDEENDVYNVQGVSVLEVLNGFKGTGELVDYMNTTLGFKVKYYDDYQLVESPDEVKILPPVPETAMDSPVAITPEPLKITRYGNPDSKTLDTFVTEKFVGADAMDSIIGADQLQSKTFQEKNEGSVYYIFERTPYFYVVSFPKSDTKFAETLNSFQFIPITDEVATTDVIPTTDVVPTTDVTPTVVTPTTPTTSATNDPLEAKTYDYIVGFSEFQNSVYNYKVNYPARWYYDGTYRDTGVLSQYRFSDASVDDTNAFASLKLLSDTTLPSGTKMIFPNGNGVKVTSGDQVKFYVQVDGKIFVVEGAADKAENLEWIAASIQKAE